MNIQKKYKKNSAVNLKELITLNTLQRPRHYRRGVVGRGRSSGHKHGRGSNGQKSRSGWSVGTKEGGQSSAYLRINKSGMTYSKPKKFVIKTSDINKLAEKHNTNHITKELIQKEYKLTANIQYKILFDVEINQKIKLEANKASKKVVEDKNLELIKL